jgi:hypothetical protein
VLADKIAGSRIGGMIGKHAGGCPSLTGAVLLAAHGLYSPLAPSMQSHFDLTLDRETSIRAHYLATRYAK